MTEPHRHGTLSSTDGQAKPNAPDSGRHGTFVTDAERGETSEAPPGPTMSGGDSQHQNFEAHKSEARELTQEEVDNLAALGYDLQQNTLNGVKLGNEAVLLPGPEEGQYWVKNTFLQEQMKLYAKEKAAVSEAKTRLATNEELAEKLNVDTSKLQHEYERLQAEHLQLQLQKKAKLDLQAKQIQERIAAGGNSQAPGA